MQVPTEAPATREQLLWAVVVALSAVVVTLAGFLYREFRARLRDRDIAKREREAAHERELAREREHTAREAAQGERYLAVLERNTASVTALKDAPPRGRSK